MFIVSDTAPLMQQPKKNRRLQTIENDASSASRPSAEAKKRKQIRKNDSYQFSKSKKNSRQHVISFHAEFHQSGPNHYETDQNENKSHETNQTKTDSYENKTNQYKEHSYYSPPKKYFSHESYEMSSQPYAFFHAYFHLYSYSYSYSYSYPFFASFMHDS